MSKFQKAMFVYPWNMEEEGIEKSLESYKSMHIDTLFVSASYHSGRFFHPKAKNKIHTRHGSGVSFKPANSLYPVELSPHVDPDISMNNLHQEIRERCEEKKISYNAWIVGLHNSSLGKKNHEYCVKNVYGDIYDYALCPNHPTVREYFSALVEDVSINLNPDSVMLETPNYLGFIHDHQHELILADLDPVCQYLLSLCFCNHCEKEASKKGINVANLKETVKEKIDFLIENERGSIPTDFSNAELASILLEEPDLYYFSRMRLESVTDLIKELKTVTNAHHKKLYAVPSIFTRPASKSWMEGTSLTEISKVADGIFLLSYFSDPNLVKADIEWVKMFVGDSPIFSVLNAGYPDALSEEGLKSNVHSAMKYDPIGIGYYNASLLTKTRLNWIGKVNGTINK